MTDMPSHWIDVERVEPETARRDMTLVDSQQVTAEADKLEYHLGETMKVKILKKNLNSRPVHTGISNIVIDLSDRTGRSWINMGAFITWDSASVLNPGEEAEVYAFALEPWYRIGWIRMPLLPGAYSIRMSMTVFTEISGANALLWLKVVVTTS